MEYTEEICDKCHQPIQIEVNLLEKLLEAGEPVLCPDCQEVDEPEQPRITYRVIPLDDLPCEIQEDLFNTLGTEGWELISVTNFAYFSAYFRKGL